MADPNCSRCAIEAEVRKQDTQRYGFTPAGLLNLLAEVNSEVRKQDTALIRQLVEALDEATTYTASAMWSPSMTNECKELVAKGRARLDGKP